jgi:hypothetical protein
MALASAFAATFKNGDLIVGRNVLLGPYENRLGIIVGDSNQQSEAHYPVVFWMGLDNPGTPFSSKVGVKLENMEQFDPMTLLKPEYVFDPSNPAHIQRLNNYAKTIVGLEPVMATLSYSPHLFILMTNAMLKEVGSAGMRHFNENQTVQYGL